MEIVYGDVLDSTENIIVHQVNHMGVMGSGLAKKIKEKYPLVFARYANVCKTSDWRKIYLGGVTDFVEYARMDGVPYYIANLFGQKTYGTGLQTDYAYLERGLQTVASFASRNSLSVAIPFGLGCGLGGGDWNIVSGLIEKYFTNKIEYKIYKLEK